MGIAPGARSPPISITTTDANRRAKIPPPAVDPAKLQEVLDRELQE
jgi:hypothetical protein